MRKKSLMTAAVLATSVLAATGCGVLRQSGAPTPADNNSVPTTGTLQDTSTAGKTQARTLYFADAQNRVLPVQVDVPLSNTPAREALDYMTDGGPANWLSGTGLHAPIPSGVKVDGIAKIGDMYRVNLSSSGAKSQTAAQQEAMVEAITWELTEFPTIKNVEIEFNNKVLPTLEPSGIPTEQALSRDQGINLQVAEDVANPADASRVTVYLDENQSGEHFLVPVTRLVPQTTDEDIIRETIAQLQAGPEDNLDAPISPSARLVDETVQGKTVTLDFDQPIFDSTHSAAEAAKALALSLQASAGIDEVKILVNGKVPTTAGGIDFSKIATTDLTVNQRI